MDNLKILFEDADILAVDKPAKILVYHPPHFKKSEETLIDLLAEKFSFSKKSERNGVVHRLDRDTSGVIILAKNKKSEVALKKLFKDRKVKKIYQTLVRGRIRPSEGLIDIPLSRASRDRLRVVPSVSGKPSETGYHLLRYFPDTDMSLLEVELKTGRMHQIRVHMSAIGHPVVGDRKYGKKTDALPRQFLHATRIEFIHPFSGQAVSVDSLLAKELKGYLDNLK